MNTEKSTGTTTASNYEGDFDSCVPVRPVLKDGPFLHKPKMKLPPKYILTKTHCGGYCMDCSPPAYMNTPESFDVSCRTGQRKDNSTKTTVTYSSSIPKKAIHLIRNPFDNLVGRMQLAAQIKSRRADESRVLINRLTNDQQGLSHWCKYLDSKYKEKELKSGNEYLQKYQYVPCHAEWFRYIQWHNLAIEVTKRLELPVYYLYYDNYTLNYEQTVSEIFDFLEVKSVHAPVEFRTGKTYDTFFSPEYAKGAARMAKDMASPDAWRLLKQYFAKWLKDDRVKTRENATLSSALKKEKSGPEVVWLMCFPNSVRIMLNAAISCIMRLVLTIYLCHLQGTSFTIRNTEKMSNTSTATNYASDWDVPVRPEFIDGPFIQNLAPLDMPSSYILTKTHCAGYCDDCEPQDFVETSGSFQEGCRTVAKRIKSGGEPVRALYSAEIPRKAVHLIRNPFDNLIARLHLTVKKKKQLGWTEEQLAAFSNSRDGYLKWCQFADQAVSNETTFISSDIKELFQNLPCAADWYRYVQWHNLAIEATQRLQLPIYVLYYENYTENFDKTVDDLFHFLELHKVNNPVPFIAGKTYQNFFSEDEARAATRLVENMASPECWKLIGHYFDPWLKSNI